MKVLVTGAAGFIGFHAASYLLARGDDVVGFDIVNDYYDPAIKEARLRVLSEQSRDRGNWTFVRANLAEGDAVKRVFAEHRFDRVIHLAAQAGVRYSLTYPESYVQSNLVGFTNILEACRTKIWPTLPSLPRRASTALTPRCLSQSIGESIIRSSSTPRLSARMN